jgi:acyl carrier protein
VLPPIGQPIDGTAVFIVDERLQPVPPGITGEIVIAGKALATGYLNQPEETAARFVHLPGDGAAIYRSGDLGRLNGRGRIEFLGRRDQQLKIRGFRIEPGEIETALKHIPGIADAVVIARGEYAAERYLVGYVVPHSGSAEDFDPEPVLAELRRTLPEHMRPGVLIAVPQIPLTPSGKHDRTALSRITAPAVGARIGCAPRTPLERRIAAIWHDVLGREAIGVTENFFELGGHSLSATRLVSQIGEAFQIDLPVRTVFDASSIEALSCEIVLCLLRKQTRTDNSVTT